MALKVIFAGTSEFAIPALVALLDSEHSVRAVYTKQDRLAGRGLQLRPSPVKIFAAEEGLEVYQPESLKDLGAQQVLREHGADILVDAAYGLYLPKPVLEMFRYGCINIHPSLLPRWRGAAPIQRAILAGDEDTGVTIMQVDAGWDSGDILGQIKIGMGAAVTSSELERILAQIGAELLLLCLEEIDDGGIKPESQDEQLSCYANKIQKEEGKIDWSNSALAIDRQVRAFSPWPVAYSTIAGIQVRIWKAMPLKKVATNEAGTIVAASKDGLEVATGYGVLQILELQFPGRKVLSVGQVLNSRRELLQMGAKFDG